MNIYAKRRAALLARMQAQGGGVAIIPTAPEVMRNADADYPYRHDSYFYYLTGFTEPEATLVLVAGAKQQAILYSQVVSLKKGDLPPVIDIENTNGVSDELLCKKLQTCLKYTEAHFGIKPIIYTYADFYEDHLAGKFDDYPLWIAHYTANKNPSVKRQWHFWQHHETGRVNGIQGPVDFNVFNGDTASFENLLIN